MSLGLSFKVTRGNVTQRGFQFCGCWCVYLCAGVSGAVSDEACFVNLYDVTVKMSGALCDVVTVGDDVCDVAVWVELCVTS